MSNPTPICLQIMQALIAILSRISVANGYATNAGANVGIDPLTFDSTDVFPAIVIEEESADITDSNAQLFREETVYAVNGFVPVKVANAMETAFALRDDLTVALMRQRRVDFVNAQNVPLAISIQIFGRREVLVAPEGLGVIQVKVHVVLSSSQIISPT